LKTLILNSADVPENRGELDVKACYSQKNSSITVKTAVGFWDNKVNYNLPTLLATIILYDAKNGYPLCLMDGSLITGYRTGAAGAISAKLLARKNSKTVGILGAGGQARMQAIALKEVFPIETIKVWSPSLEETMTYKKDLETLLPIEVIPCKTPEDAAKNIDILITTTPSKKALVNVDCIKSGTHIIAIGADMAGKQELDPSIFKHSKVVVDSIAQCLERGETRNPFIVGMIKEEDIHAEIGEILLSKKSGRENDSEITIFDSTGMGIQDNTVAKMIYDKALKLGKGQLLQIL